MVAYVNFYETVKESMMRLCNTVILYDGRPHFVHSVADHEDGVFRIFMEEVPADPSTMVMYHHNVPGSWQDEPGMTRLQKMTLFMEQHRNKITRKKMNSPLFNKFRPFPLGMVNTPEGVRYVERTPTRLTQQGLISDMITTQKFFVAAGSSKRSSGRLDATNKYLRQTILNDYPSFMEALSGVMSDKIANTSLAFHREFCVTELLPGFYFLGYKDAEVGLFDTTGSTPAVILSPKYRHLREKISELNMFEVK